MTAPVAIRHSAGPYRVVDAVGHHSKRTTIRDSENRILAVIPRHVVGWTQERGNADLFAAAPDLADALQRLLRAYEMILPGVAKISVPDYQIVNDAPVEAALALQKAGRR